MLKIITNKKISKKCGARYSELLRLPYFDTVQYHCVHVMYNPWLGTAKHMLSIWKDFNTPRTLIHHKNPFKDWLVANTQAGREEQIFRAE